MAKIPRISQGDRPSAVPGGSLPSGAEGGIFGLVGKVVQAGYEMASEAEKAEALKLRDIAEEKQMRINVVSAGKMSSDYELEIRDDFEMLKRAYWNEPEKLVPELLDRARAKADADAKDAPNTWVGMDFAKSSVSSIASIARQAHEWMWSRQTQIAKGDLEAQRNSAAAMAEKEASLAGLEVLLETTHEKLMPQYVAVYGAKAEEEWHQTAVRMTQGYALGQGDFNPLGVRGELKAARGAFAKYLTPAERESYTRKTELAQERRHQTRMYDILSEADGDNTRAVEMLNAGTLEVDTVLALQKKNISALDAAKIDPSFTPEQRATQVKMLERQGEVLAAVEEIRARGIPFNPEEQISEDTVALREVDKALKRYKGKKEQLPLITEQKDRLIKMRRERKISATGFQTGMDHINMAFRKAVTDEANNDGFWRWQDAREAGNREMDKYLEGRARGASETQKNEAWLDYMNRLLQATKGGKEIDNDAARRMARQSVSLKTGFDIREKGD